MKNIGEFNFLGFRYRIFISHPIFPDKMAKTRSSLSKNAKDQSHTKSVVSPIRVRLTDNTIVEKQQKILDKK